ncbi:MAG: class I SAM-dependent methyltransferase [Gemmatimonadaceae bacterium]
MPMPGIGDAVDAVSLRFPIEGYMTAIKSGGAYWTIASTALRYLAPGSRVLDFGCGPCDKTAILQELGYVCSGCDDLDEDWHRSPGQRESILEFARNSGIDFRRNNGDGLPFEPGTFDMVMMHDVLEHIHDSPRELMNDLVELVRPGGYLFATVPNQVNIKKRLEVLAGRTNLTAYETFYWSNDPWRGHIREYVRDDLVKLARYLNIEILELRGVDHMLQKIPRRARAPYLLVTNLLDGWKDSWLLVAKKPSTWQARRILTPAEKREILPVLTW